MSAEGRAPFAGDNGLATKERLVEKMGRAAFNDTHPSCLRAAERALAALLVNPRDLLEILGMKIWARCVLDGEEWRITALDDQPADFVLYRFDPSPPSVSEGP